MFNLNFLQISRPIDLIYSETIFTIAGFQINNSTIFIFLILLLCALFCFYVVTRFTLLPGKIQGAVELVYELIENLVLQITGSKKQTKFILPFVGSIFLFVLFSNLMGILPGLTNITYNGKALLRIPTADFSTTFSLAVASMAVIQIMSIKDFGMLGYVGRFIKIHEVYFGFKDGFTNGMISVVNLFVGFLDIIGEIAKVVSISLRLFGNMYAGIVLATVIGGIMAYVLPVFLVAMGLLVAVVQAIVFTSLVTIYYMLAIRSAPEKDY